MDEDMSPSFVCDVLGTGGDGIAGGVWTDLGLVWMFW